MESYCECGIEPPCSISHGVNCANTRSTQTDAPGCCCWCSRNASSTTFTRRKCVLQSRPTQSLLSVQVPGLVEDMYFYLMLDSSTVMSIYFDLQLPPLAPNNFFCYSNHQGAVFFFFLILSLHYSMTSRRKQFLLRL